MRGVVFSKAGTELRDDVEFRDPAPGANEVVVSIKAAGLCHSDLSVVDGTIPFPPPVVLGHEGAGVVEAVGDAVTLVAPGDTVVLSTLGNCGHCRYCADGHPTICRSTFGAASMKRPFTVGGEKAFQFANTSVFVDSTKVKETQAIKVDPQIPLAQASLIGCGVITGVGAVLNRAKVRPDDSVAVFGVGGIGLNVIQGALLAGATRIVAVDANPAKEGFATTFGATDFVDASAVDAVAAVKELTGGDGVDHAFECVGHPAVLRNSIDVLAPGGQAVILGVPKMGTEAQIPVSDMYQDKSILACRYGTSSPQRDVPALASLYLAGRLKLDELVTATYPLDGFDAAVEDMRAGKLARGVFEF